MRVLLFIFLSAFGDEDGEWDEDEQIEPIFKDDILEKYGHLGWNGFRKIYKTLDKNMKSRLHEHFRVLKRDCFRGRLDCGPSLQGKMFKTNPNAGPSIWAIF